MPSKVKITHDTRHLNQPVNRVTGEPEVMFNPDFSSLGTAGTTLQLFSHTRSVTDAPEAQSPGRLENQELNASHAFRVYDTPPMHAANPALAIEQATAVVGHQ